MQASLEEVEEEKDDFLTAFGGEESSEDDDDDWDPSKPSDSNNVSKRAGESSEEEEEEEDDSEPEMSLELLRQMMGVDLTKDDKPVSTMLEKDLTIEKIATVIKEGKAKRIVVMSGAGISVAAGIPDFRTPGTGLYDNLQKYGLPYPTAVFELDYFRNKPEPFYTLAKELYPGNYKPTAVHYFIRLLHEKGLLLRNFTQNIDTLERVAGIPGEALVEAHGSFAKAHCINCKAEEDVEVVKTCVFASQVPKCKTCEGLVKPDIVFFGESLPTRFFQQMEQDFPQCDLLIVIGTSLQVQPFASLTGKVKHDVPRLLINREEVGTLDPRLALLGLGGSTHFRFGLENNYRDVCWLGDCQDGVWKLAELLGWRNELEFLVKNSAINTKF